MKRKEEKALVAQMIQQLPTLVKEVGVLGKELKPNGGSSFRDRFDQMQAQLHRMEGRQIFSRHTHREVADAIGRMYLEADLEGNWVEVGASLLALLKCPSDSFMGRNWTSHVIMADREQVAAEWERCVEERITFSVRTHLIGCDGRQHTVTINMKVAGEGDVIAGYYGQVTLLS